MMLYQIAQGTLPVANTGMDYVAYEQAGDFNKRVLGFIDR